MKDPIERQDAIDALRYAQHRFTVADEAGGMGTVKWSEDVIYFAAAEKVLANLPPAEPEQKDGKWTTEQVAELLANMFGEECACNFNGIDEWLPSACKYSETTCPNPKEKHGCWMQFLIQGGADMRGDYNEKPM